MAIEQATLARDEMAEAEVRREAQLRSRFATQTALTWVGVFVLLIIFFAFIKLQPSFLFQLCAGPACIPAKGLPSGVIQLGALSITWSGWLFFILSGLGITLLVSVVSIALAVILAFVGALHWGFTMKTPEMSEREQWTWMGWSVIPALAAWGAGILPYRLAIALLVVTFVVHLALDHKFAPVSGLPAWYLRLRRRLTLFVVICLLLGVVR